MNILPSFFSLFPPVLPLSPQDPQSPSKPLQNLTNPEEFGYRLNPQGGAHWREDFAKMEKSHERRIAEIRNFVRQIPHYDPMGFNELDRKRAGLTISKLEEELNFISEALDSPSGLVVIGESALHKAIAAGDCGKANKLINKGHDPFTKVETFSCKGSNSMDAFEIACQLSSDEILKNLVVSKRKELQDVATNNREKNRDIAKKAEQFFCFSANLDEDSYPITQNFMRSLSVQMEDVVRSIYPCGHISFEFTQKVLDMYLNVVFNALEANRPLESVTPPTLSIEELGTCLKVVFANEELHTFALGTYAMEEKLSVFFKGLNIQFKIIDTKTKILTERDAQALRIDLQLAILNLRAQLQGKKYAYGLPY